jgi:hypothetical protein
LQYFRLVADSSVLDAGFVWDVRDEAGQVDPRRFTAATYYSGLNSSLELRLSPPGPLLDVNFGAFDIPVLSVRAAGALEPFRAGELQFLSASVAGETDTAVIMNTLNAVDCLDWERSVVLTWPPNAGRPGEVGMPKMVSPVVVDPARAHGHHIFRILNWAVALIVSSEVKALIEGAELTGAKFIPTSPWISVP